MQTWQAGRQKDVAGISPHITISSKLSAESEKSDRGNYTISRNMYESDRWQHHCNTLKPWDQRMACGIAELQGDHEIIGGHCRIQGALCSRHPDTTQCQSSHIGFLCIQCRGHYFV
jgi:hypothetical protein